MATEIQGYYEDGTAVVSFDEDYIDTTLTDSGDVVDWWVAETYRMHRRGHVAGLDVEWRPATGRAPPGPVAVLQVCVDHRCLVFQILRADYVPDALAGFLADRRFVFVGVGVRDDAARLRDAAGGVARGGPGPPRRWHAGEAQAARRGAAGAGAGGDGRADGEAAPCARQRLGQAQADGGPVQVRLRRRVRVHGGRLEALQRCVTSLSLS